MDVHVRLRSTYMYMHNNAGKDFLYNAPTCMYMYVLTGSVLSKENIQEIIKFAHSEGLFILADEVMHSMTIFSVWVIHFRLASGCIHVNYICARLMYMYSSAGLSAQHLSRRRQVPFVQESYDGDGRAVQWDGTRLLYVNV